MDSFEMSQILDKFTENTNKPADRFARKALNEHHDGDSTSAIKYAKMAHNTDPSNDRPLYIIGVLFKHQNNNEEVSNYFEKAIFITNKNPFYFFDLGIIYNKLGR